MSHAIFRTNIYVMFILKLIFIQSNNLLIICNSNLASILCFVWQLEVGVPWAHLFEARGTPHSNRLWAPDRIFSLLPWPGSEPCNTPWLTPFEEDWALYVDSTLPGAAAALAVDTVGVWAPKSATRVEHSPNGRINHVSGPLNAEFLLRLQLTVRFMTFWGMLSWPSLLEGL